MNDSKKEEWQITNSKKIYSDPWIKVRVDDVVRPSGVAGTYSVVEIKGGVGVVALTPENKIYLVGQYRYTVDMFSWEIPQGAFENFEHADDPLETAKREVEEETGIVANSWKKLGFIHTLLGSTTDEVHLFLARNLTVRESHPDDTEDIRTKTITFDEFYKMFENQEITDAASVAGVMLAEKLLHE